MTKHSIASPLGKTFAAALLAGSLALASPTAAFAGSQPETMDGFKAVKIAPDAATSDKVINLLLPYMGNHPESTEGRPSLDLSIREQGGGLIVDLKMAGYLDDSVAGEHYRGRIIESPGGWKLVELGVKYICYRSMSENGKCT